MSRIDSIGESDLLISQERMNYKVLVNCMTYNQSKYIVDALNGFAMQQTTFPFVCLVMDDASTDGEQEVIKAFLERECDMTNAEYEEIDDANIIIVPHKENHNCIFAVYFLKHNLYGSEKKPLLIQTWQDGCKYIALCEGDDYWIDSYKLQKQIDFLESNDEYSMCCSDAEIHDLSGISMWTRYEKSQKVSPEDMIKGGGLYVQTASLLYRTELLEYYPPYCKNCHVGDYPLKIWGTINGGMYWFEDRMVVYRYMAAGSWSEKMKSIDCASLIPKWRSEVEMLKGINKYTEYKYKEAVESRIAEYIYDKMLHYQDNWKMISDSFRDCVMLFSTKHKVLDFIMTHKMSWMYRIWCIIKGSPSPA